MLSLSRTIILTNLLIFFYIIKIYLIRLNLELFEDFFNKSILEACCKIKNADKVVKKIEFLQNLFWYKLV